MNLLFVLALAGVAPPMATVNGQPINDSEAVTILRSTFGKSIAEDLVRRDLARAEAKARKVSLTPSTLASTFQTQLDSIRRALPAGTDIDAALRTKSMSRARLRVLIETELLLERIALLDFRPDMFLKVSTMLIIPTTKSTSDLGEAIRKGEVAYGRLVKGDAWSAVLADTVVDPNLRIKDGLIGWRDQANIPAEARATLLSGTVGTYTKPVQTEYGIQIFRLDAKAGSAQGAELTDLKKGYAAAMRAPLMANLLKKAKVVYVPGL